MSTESVVIMFLCVFSVVRNSRSGNSRNSVHLEILYDLEVLGILDFRCTQFLCATEKDANSSDKFFITRVKYQTSPKSQKMNQNRKSRSEIGKSYPKSKIRLKTW